MAGLSADVINPFLMAGMQMLKDVSQVATTVGKATVKPAKFSSDTIVIMIGIIGEIKGQVMLAFPNNIACKVAGNMCMMEITEMNEISMSAICELGNMIMGNAATMFSTKGIGIDITPPTVCIGDVVFTNSISQNICVPLHLENGDSIDLNISVKEDQRC